MQQQAYHRLGYLLVREGITLNHKRLLRIYREEGLKVRRRDGCLSETLFSSMQQAQAELEQWRQDYNMVRPHLKLGGKTSTDIGNQWGWRHAPIPIGITSTISHKGAGLYL